MLPAVLATISLLRGSFCDVEATATAAAVVAAVVVAAAVVAAAVAATAVAAAVAAAAVGTVLLPFGNMSTDCPYKGSSHCTT